MATHEETHDWGFRVQPLVDHGLVSLWVEQMDESTGDYKQVRINIQPRSALVMAQQLLAEALRAGGHI